MVEHLPIMHEALVLIPKTAQTQRGKQTNKNRQNEKQRQQHLGRSHKDKNQGLLGLSCQTDHHKRPHSGPWTVCQSSQLPAQSSRASASIEHECTSVPCAKWNMCVFLQGRDNKHSPTTNPSPVSDMAGDDSIGPFRWPLLNPPWKMTPEPSEEGNLDPLGLLRAF